ncbi:MAG: DUF465 domain-containing protein [SAR324 cluster bacterium]|nr:DUF465 domain-containing protein [SAR324 cluster bacterium]
MEKSDLDIINKEKDTDYELAKLWEDHLSLDAEIANLEKATSEIVNHAKINELKKEKLQGRDKLEVILAKYRT